jgi:hypothetical protein
MNKHFLYLIILVASIPALGTTIGDTYAQLQKNPRYRKMMPLEIAIDRGDFEAIRYFAFRANLDGLKRARSLLLNKIANFNAIIEERHDEYLIGPEKVPLIQRVEESRRSKGDYEALLREFDRKIESAETEARLKTQVEKTEPKEKKPSEVIAPSN